MTLSHLGEDWLPAADVQCPVARTMPVVSGFLEAASSMMRLHAGTMERLTKAFEGVGLERLQARHRLHHVLLYIIYINITKGSSELPEFLQL